MTTPACIPYNSGRGFADGYWSLGLILLDSTIDKIISLRKIIDKVESDSKPLIEVDGGIKLSNIKKVADAGADVIVSGSGIFATENYSETIAEMRSLIK